jgi:hypothetical protein
MVAGFESLEGMVARSMALAPFPGRQPNLDAY